MEVYGYAGLFDQPLIMEGKRKRKSTEHFAFSSEKKRQSAGKVGVVVSVDTHCFDGVPAVFWRWRLQAW